MRVVPWNYYQLVDQEPDLDDLQLASLKNQVSRGCATFICFSRTSAGTDSPSSLKVGPTHPHDGKDHSNEIEDDGNNNGTKVILKSSLKKSSDRTLVPADDSDQQQVATGSDNPEPGHTGRRKVQWMDACGNELAEIREFELRYGNQNGTYYEWRLQNLI